MMMYSSAYARRSGKKRFADMNLIPLIDVMFVLLVVFMITAPLLTTGIPLDLPKGDGKPIAGSDKTVNISIDAAGKVFIGTDAIALSALTPKIKAITDENPEARIIISGDEKVHYGTVIEVMSLLRDAGYVKIGLKTDHSVLRRKR